MEAIKTSEKLILWMFRTGRTQQDIAKHLDISRQYFSRKLNDNVFTPGDLIKLKSLGFSG